MKTICIIWIGLLAAWSLNAQDTAVLVIHVQNENLEALAGEQFIFEGQKNNYIAKGISDQDGSFNVKLLGNETYNIKIKTVGQATEYNTIHIPALAHNTFYGENLMTVTIFEPKQFTLNNVLFETGLSALKNESKTELNELFAYLSLKDNVQIQIEGHTDNVGNDQSNLVLSEERAKAVKAYLLNLGIDANRIKTVGFGASKPVATNNTPDGRKLNRRTTVVIL